MSFKNPTLPGSKSKSKSKIASTIPIPTPTDAIYTCSTCCLIFASIQDGKDHFRTSPMHAGTYKVPVVSGDTAYDADLAARDMITVMEAIAEPLASRIKRKADNRERSSLLVRQPKLAGTKRKTATDVAVVSPKKSRVRHIDYEDNRNIQNVLTNSSASMIPAESPPTFGTAPPDKDCDLSYKDNRNIQNVFTGCTH